MAARHNYPPRKWCALLHYTLSSARDLTRWPTPIEIRTLYPNLDSFPFAEQCGRGLNANVEPDLLVWLEWLRILLSERACYLVSIRMISQFSF